MLEERRLGHHITITVVSVDFVLMYNTGILVETLALKKCSSHRKSHAELCSFSQLNFVQNDNYSERVCCQCASKIRTLYDCFSFVKSSRKKKNPTILTKQSKSTSHGEQQQSPQHLKVKADFKNKILWIKNALKKSKSKLKNKLEIRLYTGFAVRVI